MAHEKKVTKVKSDAKTKTVKVESTALVKQYIDAAWLRIAGIGVSEVATRLSRGNGVPSNSDKSISEAIQVLVRKIDQFRPMVLWSGREATPYRNKNIAWQGRLLKIAELVTKDSRPVYLVDEVNKILRSQAKSRIDEIKASIQPIIDDQKDKKELTPEQQFHLKSGKNQIKEIKDSYICTPLILAKYLHLQYQDGMTMEILVQKMEPAVIAKFITSNDGVQWEYLPVKMETKTYSVRIDEKSNWTSADVAKHIEIPYSCPSIVTAMTDKNILADIQNDIKVIDEYIAWYTSSGLVKITDEYRQRYISFQNRLKTLDLSVDDFKEQKENVQEPKKDEVSEHDTPQPSQQPEPQKDDAYEIAKAKFNSGDTLDENDQIVILKHGKCPRCGKDIYERAAGTRPDGSRYSAFLSCVDRYSCKFTAGGTKKEPEINRESEIRPLLNRSRLV